MIVLQCLAIILYWRVQLQVLVSTIASTRVFVREYSQVFLGLTLASFDSRGQCITRMHSLTLAFWHSRVMLWAMWVTCTHASIQKITVEAWKSLWSAIQNVVGRVSRNRDFFQWGLIPVYCPVGIIIFKSDQAKCQMNSKLDWTWPDIITHSILMSMFNIWNQSQQIKRIIKWFATITVCCYWYMRRQSAVLSGSKEK